jgi:DNA polymerase I-like protein with 3'-5' exonuclease and polymerase domains
MMSRKMAQKAIDLEMAAAATATRMEHNGFTFDLKSAGMLQADLAAQREEIHKALRDVFPTRVIERYSEKTGKRLKDEVIEFNPGSRDHIAYWLKKKYDWKPKVFTNGGKPMIDEEILEEMEYPEAKKLVGYFMLDKRLGMLSEGKNAWMSLVKDDGRIHGRVNTNGAATGRCTHSNPNMAQVPSVRKPYGKECRQLFTVPNGYKLVGTDLSGIELRCLAHYLALYDDGDYGREILNGDIHTRNQLAAGLPTRDAAKTFILQ